jgi:hypothetical protein
MEPEPKSESKVMGVSVRGWIASVIIVTVCVMSVMQLSIAEPLYGLAMAAMGWYFGQKEKS